MKATVVTDGALLHQPPTRYVPEAAEEGSFRSNRYGARCARRSLRSEVAAAQLRPTVAVVGGADVVGECDRRSQAAPSRAAARPSAAAATPRRHRPNVA